MENWTIRRAAKDDAAALSDCIHASYSIYTSRIKDLPPVSDGIAEEIETNLVWIALREKKIIGGMIVAPAKEHVFLMNLASRPDTTGLGLGRVFMDLLETEARQLSVGKMLLSTHVEMPENVKFYCHLGWTEIGRSGNKVSMEKLVRADD